MNIELDMHTHTLASGHAFSTLQETEFPEALIVNRSVEVFRNHLKRI